MQPNIRTLQIIHLALVIGVTMAYIIVGKLYSLDFLNFPELNNTALYVILGAVAAVVISNLIYKQQLKQVPKSATYQEQFVVYQTATIMRLAILEGAAFLLLFLVQEVLIIGLLLIVYMVLIRPSEERMKNDFNNTRLL
jgi:hypothetical protein